MVNLEEAIYRAAMAPPIQILPATVSEMPLIGLMNLYMHVGVSEKKPYMPSPSKCRMTHRIGKWCSDDLGHGPQLLSSMLVIAYCPCMYKVAKETINTMSEEIKTA